MISSLNYNTLTKIIKYQTIKQFDYSVYCFVYFCYQVVAGAVLQITSAQDATTTDFREGKELILSISDDSKTQYLNQDFETS